MKTRAQQVLEAFGRVIDRLDEESIKHMVLVYPIPDRLICNLDRAPLLREGDPVDGCGFEAWDKPLTPSQLLLVRYASHGLNNLETADATGWNYDTVKTQMKVAMRKMRAKNRTHLVALALRAGLIP